MKSKSKLKVGIQLVKESFNVASSVNGLYFLMICSFFCTLVSLAAFFGFSYLYAGDFESLAQMMDSKQFAGVLIIGGFIQFFIFQFLSIFFNVALFGAIRLHFENKPTSFYIAIQFALSKFKLIFSWACVSFVIGNLIAYIFKPVGEQFSFFGSIFKGLLGLTWGVATYFVIPMIAFERNKNIKEIIKDSAKLVKEKLPEQIGAKVYISTLYFMFAIVLFITFVIGIFSAVITGFSGSILPFILIGISFSILILGMIILSLITNMTYAVLNVAMYDYAKKGNLPPQFNQPIILQAI